MDYFSSQIKQCTECEACMKICPTHENTNNLLFSPLHRLKTAENIFQGNEITDEMIESIYNCPMCMRCEEVCPQEIKITAIMQKTREELVKKGLGPLDKHDIVIDSILTKGNSVNSDPSKRLEWLAGESFPSQESDTLLYLGCLPSYLVKESAISTFKVLKKLGVNFMMLEDEGCCGTYIYQSGRREMAEEFFSRNVERFKSLGIKKIIAPCNGCFKCFKHFYPEVLGSSDFTVVHAVEVIHGCLKQNPEILKKIPRKLTYQDPCRLARGEHLTEEPREILQLCGAELSELKNNRQNSSCCGAGAGIRSIYRKLSANIAENLLNSSTERTIVSACPFCTFNLSYTAKKKKMDKDLLYFTQVVFESLQE